jgi:hypothetical protein
MNESPGMSHSDDGTMSAGVPAKSSSRARARLGRRRDLQAASPHAAKFRSVTAVLVGLAVGAVVVAVALAIAGRPVRSSSFTWSPWHPLDGGNLGAQDIAEYVAPPYRATPADQLAVVTVVNLESAVAAAAAAQAQANGTTTSSSGSQLQVAVRPSASSSQLSLLNGSTVAYDLCGIGGKSCAIGVGTPSVNRTLLLRREALELALYTFEYIKGTNYVVAILPPGRPEPITTALSKTPPTTDAAAPAKPVDMAVLFARSQLAPLLRRPLDETLPELQPPTVAEMPYAREAQLVSEVTAPGLFGEQLQQSQDGSSLIILQPLPAQ